MDFDFITLSARLIGQLVELPNGLTGVVTGIRRNPQIPDVPIIYVQLNGESGLTTTVNLDDIV